MKTRKSIKDIFLSSPLVIFQICLRTLAAEEFRIDKFKRLYMYNSLRLSYYSYFDNHNILGILTMNVYFSVHTIVEKFNIFLLKRKKKMVGIMCKSLRVKFENFNFANR